MCYLNLSIKCLVFLAVIIVLIEDVASMSKEEKRAIRDEVKEMFYHAYQSYMNNAYPHDELMPLSCTGRHRGTMPSRGDVDDILGNFSLTLVDSFDTLVVMGDIEEFEKAVKLVIKDVTFDRDIVVSVFETNIRMLGGLLSGHVLAEKMHRHGKGLSWYKGELLEMAKDLGYRLLPAFNTTTGIPYPRVNLIHGVKQEMARTGHERDTCTACAGTMLLEFAALSRLSGEPIFEAKAHKAMDSLWQYRHRSSNLVGTVINIHNGEWVRRDAGIGAGTDSYYEYLLKAYILLGDDTYLDRFNKHYESIMKYINQGPIMLDVHMHRPHSNSKNFMDSLFAFWPGLQVLKGDIKPAIEIHEMLYQVMQRHNFLPEAFTTDFRVHWAQHPLRPEFIESTYFLFRATGDSHYLDVGKKVIDNLNKHARVACGYASIKDVTTGKHEDQMDSFVLSETFKYLYLLFSEEEDLLINIDDFIFTTEAHLLPLTLSLHEASPRNITLVDGAILYNAEDEEGEEDDAHRTCPNNAHVFKNNMNYAHNLRVPLRNMVESVCPRPRQGPRRPRLHASDFIAGNLEQVTKLHKMGIKIVTMSDGRVQLLHTASDADSVDDAEDGMLFMQEMIELSKTQAAITQQETRIVQVVSSPYFGNEVLKAGPAQFGYNLQIDPGIKGPVAIAEPINGCTQLLNPELVAGNIVIVERGNCMFVDKARTLEAAGAIGGIVIDNVSGSTAGTNPVFAMSGDGKDDVTIPMVFLFQSEGTKLKDVLKRYPPLTIYLGKEPLSPDLVVREALLSNKFMISSNKPLHADLIEVSVTEFSHEDDNKNGGAPEKLAFNTHDGRPMCRILKKIDAQKLEFQFEKRALQDHTKLKMTHLIEKVVGLIQTNMNFGHMNLKQQSDYLFSLGKLMEASVNENSQSALEQRIRKILDENLKLSYSDIVDIIDKQYVSDIQDDTYKRRDQTFKLKQGIFEMLDTYIEDQLNQVYSEAKDFLGNLGDPEQDKEDSGQDQSLQIPETDDTASSMPDIQQKIENSEETVASHHKNEDAGSEPKQSLEKATKKVRFETKDGRVKHANYVDFSGGTKNNDKVIREQLKEAYDTIEKAMFRKAKAINEQVDSVVKSGVRIRKPPDWMILKDEEIFVDAEGIIYANYGYEQEGETMTIYYDGEKGTQSVVHENTQGGSKEEQQSETSLNEQLDSSVNKKTGDKVEVSDESVAKFAAEIQARESIFHNDESSVDNFQTQNDPDHHDDPSTSDNYHHQSSNDHYDPQPSAPQSDDEVIHPPNYVHSSENKKNIPTVHFDASYIDLEKETVPEKTYESESESSENTEYNENEFVNSEEEQQDNLRESLESLKEVLSDLSEGDASEKPDSLDALTDILDEINTNHLNDHLSGDGNGQSDNKNNDHHGGSDDSNDSKELPSDSITQKEEL